VRRFLTDYARNPVNLLMLVLVPVVFVVVAVVAIFAGGITGRMLSTANGGTGPGGTGL